VYEKRDTQEDAGLCEQCLRNSYLLLHFYGYEKKSKVIKAAYYRNYGKNLISLVNFPQGSHRD